ncbi:hypothetical protein H1R20_g3020, partial [Candolleomyces eurysporus]
MLEVAQARMEEINPLLAKYSPRRALELLRLQLVSYMRGDFPFDRKRLLTESLRDWWAHLSAYEDARVLAALAIKIFSSMPISIVNNSARCITEWLNTNRHGDEEVPKGVPDYLAIRTYLSVDQEDKRTKCLDLNWKDIQNATVNKEEAIELTDRQFKSADTIDDMDLSEWQRYQPPAERLNHRGDVFDLAAAFNLSHFKDVLSDTSSLDGGIQRRERSQRSETGLHVDKTDCDALFPGDEEWAVWA